MYLVDGRNIVAKGKTAKDAVRDAYVTIGQDIYAVGVDWRDGIYVDYYFDGEEELQFVYSCPQDTDRHTFLHAYAQAMKNVFATKCENVRDVYLDSLVLTRAYANYVLCGNSMSDCSLENLKHEHLPSVVEGFSQNYTRTCFKSMRDIGFYLIVPDADWFEFAVQCGVKTIQLRSKCESITEVEKMVERCSKLARESAARLIVNDYWDLALKYGAFGVHLGREDVKTADLDRILESGVHLGLSTHCYHELARAMFFHPSYVALGPIFHTTSKNMDFKPQGLGLLKQWVRHTRHAVVAIGGVTLSNVDAIMDCGVEGVAVISAVTGVPEPGRVIKDFLKAVSRLSTTVM